MRLQALLLVFVSLTNLSKGLPVSEEREFWELYVNDQALSVPTKLPTRQPVAQRTLVPTETPTIRTIQSPTLTPTLRPVDTPFSAPSTAVPITAAPLPTPASATANPTALVVPTLPSPTLSTASPTSSTSALSSDLPSVLPTVFPSEIFPRPPLQPTQAPASSGECVLQVNGTCSVPRGLYAGQNCNDLGLTTFACSAQPTNMTFKYTPGGCNGSSHRLGGTFSCVDGSTAAAEEAYVVATGNKDGTVLFRGWVREGQYMSLNTGQDEERLPDVTRVKLFGSNETGDPANLIQEIQFPTSCETPFRLKDQLGAFLLSDFSSPEQGEVSCFVPVSTSVNIGVLEATGVNGATITTLELLSNYAGLQDFSDLVAGVTLAVGESINVELPEVLLDLTVRRRYTGLIQTAATANPSGLACAGTSFNSFVAGSPLPALPETVPPSASPSSSSTIDNSNSECTVSASISCECISDEGIPIGSCDQIPDPRDKTCSDDAPATRLVFLYRGLDGGLTNPNRVVIDVASVATGIEDSQIVTLGSTFRVEGNFGGSLQVSVSEFDPSGVGRQLDLFTIDTTCSSSNPTLTLTSRLGSQGALELVGFENALGYFSSLAVIRLLYSIENIGDGALVVESAVVESEFLPGALDIMEEQITIPRGEERVVFSETSQINTGRKFSDNLQFEFTLNTQATALRSGLGCSAETENLF